MFEVIPFIGAALAVGYLLASALSKDLRISWIIPALICAAFLAWTLFAVVSEGPLGFWAIHTGSAWANQVWFDLLIGIAVAWTVLLPKARRLGLRPLPWAVLILCTGCIGLTAMFARILWLEQNATLSAR
jgi:hypothetical protein